MNTIEYLDAVKRRIGKESDYAVAKALGINESTISGYRKRGGQMDDEIAAKVAALLKLHPALVILDMHRERAQTAELRAVWSGLMEKFSESFNTLLSRPWSGVERRRDLGRRLAHARG